MSKKPKTGAEAEEQGTAKVAIDEVVTTAESNRGDTTQSELDTENKQTADTAPASQEATRKSIVPAKYAGKYSKGGSDDLAKFINEQSADQQGKFSFEQFFKLARVNGLPEDKVATYEAQVAEKRHGAPGRARMTIRNMLATVARKGGNKLKGVDEQTYDVNVPAREGKSGTTAPDTVEQAPEQAAA